MNYIERALEKSDALRRAREQSLGRGLAHLEPNEEFRAPAGAILPEETAETVMRTEEAMQARQTFSPVRQLMRKLMESEKLLTQGVASGTADVRSGSGTAWLMKTLRGSEVAGLAAANARESVTVREIVREGLDTQALSGSLERDARRYDGGFLLY